MAQCNRQHKCTKAFSPTRAAGTDRAMCVRVLSHKTAADTQNSLRYCKDAVKRAGAAALSGMLTFSILTSGAAYARPAGVNRPELLPREQTSVIDVAGFLAPSEEKRLVSEVESLERDTGIKVRVLAQNYPETPGLAIREYWGVDDSSVVMVADPTFGDILNFNVGAAVDLEVPRSFWSRLAGKYGNKFFWQEKGEAAAIMNAVSAIDTCLREPQGRAKCSTVQGTFDE